MKHDAMLVVQSGLINRIDSLAARRDSISIKQLCDEVDSIRHDARVWGMEPVERMASMLESALAMGSGLGPVISSYLAMMRDAVRCDHPGPDETAVYLAALSLRLGR